jgi:uncharacterized repeat protein (TIGR04138 family)
MTTRDLIEFFRILSLNDLRYRFGAYVFIHESLEYAQRVLKYGADCPTAPREGEDPAHLPEMPHLTGQQLCEAARRMALERYGRLALPVLRHLGFRSTSDFGELVFKLIDEGVLRKSTQDRREDFDNVYDFDQAFHYELKLPDSATEESA